MAPSSAAMLSEAGYSDAELDAFGRALARVRDGQDEDAAAEAEGVETAEGARGGGDGRGRGGQPVREADRGE